MIKATSFLVIGSLILAATPTFADSDDDDDDGGGLQMQVEDLRDRLESLEGMVGGEDLAISVSCPAESIGEALDAAPLKGRLVITISGTCEENVTITRNDVTLQGLDPTSSGIMGVPETDPFTESPITLIGAQRIVIQNLTIAGGGGSSGVGATGSFVTVRNSVIEGHGFNGVALTAGTVGRIEDSTIQDNSTNGVFCTSAFVHVINSTIRNNPRDGVRVESGCRASVGESILGDPGGNTITGNRNGVAAAFSGAAFVSNNTIEKNAENGVLSVLGGTVFLRDNTIRENDNYGVLIVDGADGQLNAGNTVESDAPDFFVGAAVGVFRNSSLVIRGGGNTIATNAPFAPSPLPNCNSSQAGAFALDVEINSTIRQDGGHATVIGNVESFNLSTADLRDIDITGNIFVDGLNANVRLRDQGTVAGNVTVTGDICLFGPLSIRSSAVIDGFIDCNGGFPPSGVTFIGGGFRNCQ